MYPIFKLRLGALIPRSVSLSVCLLVLQELQKNYKTFQKLYKTFVKTVMEATKCYKTLQNRLRMEMNSLQKTPQYSLFT